MRERFLCWAIVPLSAAGLLTGCDNDNGGSVATDNGNLVAADTIEFSEATESAMVQVQHSGPTVDRLPDPPDGASKLGFMGGVVMADLNDDGWNDVFIPNGAGGTNTLLLNQRNEQILFRDVTQRTGVGFRDDESVAAVAADFNNDGQTDLYVTTVGDEVLGVESQNRLFLNQGNDADGIPMFDEVAAEVGAQGNPFARYQMASTVDFDRDGTLDLFLSAHHPVVVPALASDDPDYPDPSGENPYKRPPAQQGLLLRGGLDQQGNLAYEDVTDRLRNEASQTQGDDGRPIFNSRLTFDGVWTDVNDDGWPDLLMANDIGTPGLFLNEQGSFRYASPDAGLEDMGIGARMTMTVGDISGNGAMDFFASNVGASVEPIAQAGRLAFDDVRNTLALNDGDGNFTNRAEQAGIDNPSQSGPDIAAGQEEQGGFGWGGQMADFNNNGRLDLFYLGNWWSQGFGYQAGFGTDHPALGRPNHGHLFKNEGAGEGGNPLLEDLMTTEQDRDQLGIDIPFDTRSVAVGDLNQNGYPDMVVTTMSGVTTVGNAGGPAPDYQPFDALGDHVGEFRIFRNEGQGNNVLTVHLEGTTSNRDGIGSRITVVADGQRQVRELRAGEGHLSQNPTEVLFGVGDSDQIDRLEVRWPNGQLQTETDIDLADGARTLEVVEE